MWAPVRVPAAFDFGGVNPVDKNMLTWSRRVVAVNIDVPTVAYRDTGRAAGRQRIESVWLGCRWQLGVDMMWRSALRSHRHKAAAGQL
jgi:hypothetical protein